MNILVACEESQRVCKAFREQGHNAYSCDIEPCSGGRPEWHIRTDVLTLLAPSRYHWPLSFQYVDAILFQTSDGELHEVSKWDMLIAFPPCTYLTKAGACNIPKHPERIELGEQAREFFMKLYTCGIERIAIENPVPMKRFNLPKPSMHFQPYEFDDGTSDNDYSKYTYLWLKNLPPLMPTVCPDFSYKYPSWCKVNESDVKDRAKNRSKTFPGVARAMALQWGGGNRRLSTLSRTRLHCRLQRRKRQRLSSGFVYQKRR